MKRMTAPALVATPAARRSIDNTLTGGLARWLRGAAVGLSATALALGGHVLGGGQLPSSAPLVACALATVLGSVALSGRRWTLPPLLGVLLGVQAAFHVAFAGAAPAAANHALPGAHHTVMTVHHTGWEMGVAHIAAALLTGLVLRRGEDLCWRLVVMLSRPLRVFRVLTHPAPADLAPHRIVGPALPLARRWMLVDVAPRRGPPALSAN
jgi:hypothetical protein